MSTAHRELLPASVPFVVTRAIKSALRAYGYTDEQIAQLTSRKGHLRPSHGWACTIAPAGRAPERLPNRSCTSMLSAGPRRRPESHASLRPPQ
jgi:hypothetical protein